MDIDVTALKRALFDLFKFNTKDFYVQGSPTGFLVGLLPRQSSSSSSGGSVVSQVRVNQSISGALQTFTSSAQATAAAALALSTAQQAVIDTNTDSAYATVFATSVFNQSVLLSDSFPVDLDVSFKKISLSFDGTNYVAQLDEQRFENFLFIQKNGPITRFTISYEIVLRTTTTTGGIPTPVETILSTSSFNAPLSPLVSTYSVQLTKALSYPDITARAWPSNPTTPTGVFTEYALIELVYRITGITPT